MDAVKFLVAYDYMCRMQQDCIGCPAKEEICMKRKKSVEEAAELVKAVEAWTKSKDWEWDEDEEMGD